MKTYPVCLINLDQKKCVVIGGGNISCRKTKALLEAGANVTIISPLLTTELEVTAKRGQVTWIARNYKKGDLKNSFLAIAATNNNQVNQEVFQEAIDLGILVNVVDDPQHSNFILPAIVKRGEIQIAISTGGASPALARRLRESLEEFLKPEYEQLAEILAELRPELIAQTEPGEPRLQTALNLLDSPILEVIRSEGKEAALNYARQIYLSSTYQEKGDENAE